jgi:hypothetical protein
MNTQQLVSLLKNDFAPGYARTKLLSYVERAQNELFGQDCAQTKFYNVGDTTLPLPILSTTEGTLKYIPSESNLVDSDGNALSLTINGYDVTIRKIERVFINVSGVAYDYDNVFVGRTFNWAGINENWSRRLYNVKFQEVPAILYDRTSVEDAHLVFAEDPKTHTDKYYVEFYINPVPLDSERIPLTIDADKWAEAIIRAVRGYIEEGRNGRSELLDGGANTGSFRNYWLPKFRNSGNYGSEAIRPYAFDTRECL